MDQTFEKRKKVILDFISDDMYVPMKIKEIAIVLQSPREQRDDLKEVLDVLVEEGKISLSKRGKYSKGQAVRLKGVFQANARGFGFVTPEDGAEDVFIPEENIAGAFQGDQVEYILSLRERFHGGPEVYFGFSRACHAFDQYRLMFSEPFQGLHVCFLLVFCKCDGRVLKQVPFRPASMSCFLYLQP